MRTKQYAAGALALLLTACGSTTAQRAATGGLTGAGVGGIVGGPIGLVVGGVVGSAGGALAPESADQIAMDVVRGKGLAAAKPQTETVGSSVPPNNQPSASASPRAKPPGATASVQITPDLVRQIQTSLKAQGLYQGPIDGRLGPDTRSGLAKLQARGGTAGIDLETMQMLVSQGPSDESGSSTAPPNQSASPPGQPPAAEPPSQPQQPQRPPPANGGDMNQPAGR
jgi:osmotically inducible lipoprotein OsmB